jgi:F0F1-type ATP synthase delta subunit
MEEFYAQALYNLSQQPGADAKTLVKELQGNLKAQGRTKLLPRILKAFTRLDEKNRTLAASVEVAHAKEAKHALAEAAKYGIVAHEAITNHDLISGWRASGNGKIIDQSGKRALIDLYRSITTH